MKTIVMVGEMLTNVSKGIYTKWIWYSDGTMETIEVPGLTIPFPIAAYLRESK